MDHPLHLSKVREPLFDAIYYEELHLNNNLQRLCIQNVLT
jgi:hypothetical protein